ncbi:MAG: type II toxin-antitoxin system MqsA family antitoxin [Planctomycetota bacterium]|jgi:YgiT-type zinc finger domain-containing protein
MMEQDQQLPETCEQCGNSTLRSELVRSAFWHEERLVVVENVPALVCAHCSERYFDDTTVMLIDLLRGEGFPPEKARGELRVPVFVLQDSVGHSEEP